MDLPIDPVEYAGTYEYQDYWEERARRAYLLRVAMMEDEEFNSRSHHQ